MSVPSIVATAVKCPECGARLAVHDDALVTKCSYCGTEARVQRRTQILQRPKPLPPPRSHEPRHVAVEIRSRRQKVKLAFVVALFLLPFAFVGGVLFYVFTRTEWEGNHLSTADCDGDGVEDFIGFARNTTRDHMYLTAYSGKDGHELWQTPSLGTYTSVYQDSIAAEGVTGLELEMVADKLAHLEAYELKTGARRWRVDTGEVVSSFCHSGSGERPRIATADKRVWSVNIADGKLEPATGGCEYTGWTQVGSFSANIAGMESNGIYARGAGPRVVIGYRSPGTRVPMIAALDANDSVLWKAEIPSSDPLTTNEINGTPHMAISDANVAIVYERKSGKRFWLTVFDRMTGKRRFEVSLAKSPRVVSGVRFTPDAVAVETWGTLQVFDLATGDARFVIGH